MTLAEAQQQIEFLSATLAEHSEEIAALQGAIARKRKAPKSNGKVEILDKKTGAIYPSKNNCYQSLLKAGDLKELVDKGVFGDDPAKNNFGWFALQRSWPERFEERKQEEDRPEEKPTEGA